MENDYQPSAKQFGVLKKAGLNYTGQPFKVWKGAVDYLFANKFEAPKEGWAAFEHLDEEQQPETDLPNDPLPPF
jgi:hypothetical protein